MADVILLRHGRTDWNDQGRLQGRTDTNLNAEGLSGASRAAMALSNRGIVRIVSSPLIRAQHTARIVADHLGLPVEVDIRLIERNFGGLEGRRSADIIAEYRLDPDFPLGPDFPYAETLPESAENWSDLRARAGAVHAEVTARDTPGTGAVLLVSHLATLAAMAEQVTGTRILCANCDPIVLARAAAVTASTAPPARAGCPPAS